MAESSRAGEPLAAGRCPWCSHPLDDQSVTTCPHCGAALHAQLEGDLPGVTQVDAMALATQRRVRGGGVRALIGLTDEDTEGSPALSVPEPPSEDVRREMLRLRIDALEAEIEAQNAALAAARAAAAAAGGAQVTTDATTDGGPVEPTAATPSPAATTTDDEAAAPDASA